MVRYVLYLTHVPLYLYVPLYLSNGKVQDKVQKKLFYIYFVSEFWFEKCHQMSKFFVIFNRNVENPIYFVRKCFFGFSLPLGLSISDFILPRQQQKMIKIPCTFSKIHENYLYLNEITNVHLYLVRIEWVQKYPYLGTFLKN